jgi:anaerobic selenocysteine-containing dehydrogenase
VLARDEEPQATTQESMFNFVRLSAGGERRLDGPRSEVEIIREIGERYFDKSSPIDWQALRQTCSIRQIVAKVIPGFEQLEAIDQSREEFHIPGRIFHKTQFPTASGRAHFHVHALPPLRGTEQELRLMTVRSEGQFNTVVYEEEDIYRGQDRRNVILLNPKDMERLGLSAGQEVTVRSAVGSMPNILARPHNIRAGNALMYYPEANALVPTTTDPGSKTPAFKAVLVTLEVDRARPRGEARGESLNREKRRLPLDVLHR